MASLPRRAVLAALPSAWLAACEPKMPVTVSTTPRLDLQGMGRAVSALAHAARPGVLGVGLMNLESGQSFAFNGDRPFPMQGVAKLPIAAAVLSETDAGRLATTDRLVLIPQELSPPFSPIAETWPGRRDYGVGELLETLILDGDNTAADVLMKRIGGPGIVQAWLTASRVADLRVDRYQRELQVEASGMPSFRPAWRGEAAFARARDAIAPAKRLAAMRRYMADPRDTATPNGLLDFLQKLDRRELLSPASTRRLVELMGRTTRGGGRIRAGLPGPAFLAHRPGTSGVEQGLSAAHNDVGIFTLADGRSYALAVLLSGTLLDAARRDRIIAEAARAAVGATG